MTSQALPIHPDSGNAIPSRSVGKDKAVWFGCSGCENRWTGLNSAHCAGCHHSFTSVAAFDLHRRGDKCLEPATILTRKGQFALVPADRPWIGWSKPGTWDGPQ